MLGAVLQGCGRDPGDDGDASGVGPLGLLLRPASGSAIEPAKIRVVQRLEAPPEIEPWRVSAERTWMEGDTLWLKGMGPHRIRIPGPFDPRAFDQAALNVVATSPISVRLHWMRGEQEAMGTSRIHLPRVSEAPQTVLFTLLGNRGRTGDYTGVELEVEGWNAPPGEPLSWGLCAFDLVDRPAASWLPAGPEQVRLVQVGYEARRGFGLSSGEPLTGEFRSSAGCTSTTPTSPTSRPRSGGSSTGPRTGIPVTPPCRRPTSPCPCGSRGCAIPSGCAPSTGGR